MGGFVHTTESDSLRLGKVVENGRSLCSGCRGVERMTPLETAGISLDAIAGDGDACSRLD